MILRYLVGLQGSPVGSLFLFVPLLAPVASPLADTYERNFHINFTEIGSLDIV